MSFPFTFWIVSFEAKKFLILIKWPFILSHSFFERMFIEHCHMPIIVPGAGNAAVPSCELRQIWHIGFPLFTPLVLVY